MIRFSKLLLLASLGFAVAACGGGGSGTPAATTPTPTPTPAKSASVPEALTTMETGGTTPALDRSATVAGPDTNSNGVRDDVDRYIDAKADTTPQKQSLRMTSKAMGSAMSSDASNATALRTATDALNMAVACIWKNYPADTADKMVAEMRKVTVNTRVRYDAYMKYNAAVAGAVIKLPKEVVCE
jgi:hypothetical protein